MLYSTTLCEVFSIFFLQITRLVKQRLHRICPDGRRAHAQLCKIPQIVFVGWQGTGWLCYQSPWLPYLTDRRSG